MIPPLELPTIQHWSCHNCGGCCRQHEILITEEERLRILGQQWGPEHGLEPGRTVIERAGGLPWRKRYRLGHQTDGACIFLDERGLCRIHARYGEQAKPLACRIYPFAFHPSGRKVAVSLRFSCPSVVADRGRSMAEQREELKVLARLVVPEWADRVPPPAVSPGVVLDWQDTLRIVAGFSRLLSDPHSPAELKIRRGLALASFLGQASFTKVRGPRLHEFLDLIEAAAVQEVVPQPGDLHEPSKLGRVQFRLLAAQYARRDTFAEPRGIGRRLWLLRAILRFMRGKGTLPALQAALGEVPFAALEVPFGGLRTESDLLLTRYLLVKVQGLHFCGPAYYNVPIIEGYQSLALVCASVLYISRWLAATAGRAALAADDVAQALAIADHHHGYSPAFGRPGFRGRARLLARLGDLERLVAWYAR
jgi:lysine-N-methylase